MIYTIYSYTNTINGKKYIGQTRTTTYKRAAKGYGYKKCIAFWRAIKKYGWDAFDCTELASCSNNLVADYLEQTYIQEFNTMKTGYNIKPGGNNTGHSAETKLKIGNKAKGRKMPPRTQEYLDNLSKIHKGKTVSAETKLKQSNARKGITPWNKGKVGVQIPWNKGKTMSEEIKVNMSESAKKRWKKL